MCIWKKCKQNEISYLNYIRYNVEPYIGKYLQKL